MIHVVAQVEVKADKRESFLAEFHKIVPTVLQEAGCIEYGPTVDADTGLERQQRNPNVVTIIERWESLEALEAHLVAPHMQDYRERVSDLVVTAKLSILRPA